MGLAVAYGAAVDNFALSNPELLALVESHRPPQSWYDEDHTGLYDGSEMTPYRSANTAGVTAYHLGAGFITLQFANGKLYSYTAESAGSEAVTEMKQLALKGAGLSGYLTKRKPKHAWSR